MAQTTTHLRLLDGRSVPIDDLEAQIEGILEKAHVAGLSCAVINDRHLVYAYTSGYRDKSSGAQNDQETLFSAASFSKTVFAYLVMLLVEDEVIDLDEPLSAYLAKPLDQYPAFTDLEGDKRTDQITARMALSHTTGFPNLRSLEPDGRLKFLFPPGERYSYSGEGINLLQMVVEEITDQDLETLAQVKIFQPLGMIHSSFILQPANQKNAARPHDQFGRPMGLSIQQLQMGGASAGGSMATTAIDYARFISHGILNVAGNRKATIEQMLRPQIAIHSQNMFGPGAWQETDQYQSIHLAWSLGFGRFETLHGGAFFHTGHGPGWQNYTVTYPDKGIGIVLLSNSDNFESVAHRVLAKAIGDQYTPFDWLGYVPFDPSRPRPTPPPDPVAIHMDPSILQTYAGAYHMGPDISFQVKFEDHQLWLLSQDGQSWNLLSAESQTRFFIKEDLTYRFEFIREAPASPTALRVEVQGIPILVASKSPSD